EQSHEVELLGDVARDRLGAHRDLGRDARRRDGCVEDVVAVPVLDRHIGGAGPVHAARDDDRDLRGEIDQALEDAEPGAHLAPRRAEIAVGADHHLALAVIAQPYRLEHRFRADLAHRLGQRLLARHFTIARGGDVDRAQEVLLLEAVLRDAQRIGPGAHRLQRGEHFDALGRHVLELEGNNVDRGGELAQGGAVAVIGGGGARGHALGRALRLGREDVAAIAQRRRGKRGHAAELAAAQDADGAARLDHQPSGRSPTASVCSWRQWSSAAATALSPSARIEAARRAALTAPGLPMASVPTGTPPGICTMESRLSMPLSAALSIGTPSTGSGVSDATMPGRWAAPPAPTMITLRPRWRAPSA